MRTRPYKHKLNLLEPGAKLCKAIGALFLAGVTAHAFGCRPAACILWGSAGLLLLVLLVLLCIEQHQDRVMLELARREDEARAKERKGTCDGF